MRISQDGSGPHGWNGGTPRGEAQAKTSNSLIWERFKKYFTP